MIAVGQRRSQIGWFVIQEYGVYFLGGNTKVVGGVPGQGWLGQVDLKHIDLDAGGTVITQDAVQLNRDLHTVTTQAGRSP